jgi:hypothetical protein
MFGISLAFLILDSWQPRTTDEESLCRRLAPLPIVRLTTLAITLNHPKLNIGCEYD